MVLLVRAERVPFLRSDILERMLWFLLRLSYRRAGESRIWGMPDTSELVFMWVEKEPETCLSTLALPFRS